MIEREKFDKVIKGMECCKNGFCGFCPYWGAKMGGERRDGE